MTEPTLTLDQIRGHLTDLQARLDDLLVTAAAATDAPTPPWAVDILIALREYEDVHGEPVAGWGCLDTALAAVPDGAVDHALGVAVYRARERLKAAVAEAVIGWNESVAARGPERHVVIGLERDGHDIGDLHLDRERADALALSILGVTGHEDEQQARAERAEAAERRLRTILDEALRTFTNPDHSALQSGWIPADQVQRWRDAVLAGTAFEPAPVVRGISPDSLLTAVDEAVPAADTDAAAVQRVRDLFAYWSREFPTNPAAEQVEEAVTSVIDGKHSFIPGGAPWAWTNAPT